MKRWLGILALALLSCLAVLASLPIDAPVVPADWEPSRGPWFEVQVVKPRAARPLAGLLPDGFPGLPPSVLRFGHASPGAAIGAVAPGRLELGADGFDLLIETDAGGRIAPGTRLVFSLELADRPLTLCCRPAEGAEGFLATATREDSDALDGSFLVELAACERAETGKAVAWPPAALIVRGSFAGLPRHGR